MLLCAQPFPVLVCTSLQTASSRLTSMNTMVRPSYKTVIAFSSAYGFALVFASLFSQHMEWLKFIPLKCPLNFIFGISCPTCGLGRSLVMAFAFSFEKANAFHFLGVPIFGAVTLGLVYLWVAPILRALHQKYFPRLKQQTKQWLQKAPLRKAH